MNACLGAGIKDPALDPELFRGDFSRRHRQLHVMALHPAVRFPVTRDFRGVHVEHVVLLHLPGPALSRFRPAMHVTCDRSEHLASAPACIGHGFFEILVAPVFFLAPEVASPDRVGAIAQARWSVVRKEQNGGVVTVVDQRFEARDRCAHGVDAVLPREVSDARQASTADRMGPTDHDVERHAAGLHAAPGVADELHAAERTLEPSTAAFLSKTEGIAQAVGARGDLGAELEGVQAIVVPWNAHRGHSKLSERAGHAQTTHLRVAAQISDEKQQVVPAPVEERDVFVIPEQMDVTDHGDHRRLPGGVVHGTKLSGARAMREQEDTGTNPLGPTLAAPPILAIFVGGRSRRMGEHKGLLRVPGGSEPILEALVRRGRDAGLLPVLVGEAAPYEHLAPDVARIADDPPGAGPLAGLHAALRHASKAGRSHVIAIACDMPYVSPEALRQVRDHARDAAVVAPRRGNDAPWEPLLARYDAAQLAELVEKAIQRGQRSFQQLFSLVLIEPLPLSTAIERALEDWDMPEDVVR